jgi:hypothetical protein
VADQTILVAAASRDGPGQRELEHLVAPAFARRFHGRVEVHDVEMAISSISGDRDGCRCSPTRRSSTRCRCHRDGC